MNRKIDNYEYCKYLKQFARYLKKFQEKVKYLRIEEND